MNFNRTECRLVKQTCKQYNTVVNCSTVVNLMKTLSVMAKQRSEATTSDASLVGRATAYTRTNLVK